MEHMPVNLFTTVHEARKWLKDNASDGAICPCCGRITKIYKRKIYNATALALIEFYKKTNKGTKFGHLTELLDSRIDYVRNSGRLEFPKFKHLEMIEGRPPEEEEDKKCSGFWKLTEHGRQFVLGQMDVPKYVLVCNDAVVDYSDEMIYIHEALDQRFSYRELMEGF